jgi:hypothetical protein
VPLRSRPAKKQDSGRTVQKQVEIQMRFLASFGDNHRGELYADALERIKKLIKEEWPDTPDGRGVNFTSVGGYYLVDGKVCLVQDFDPEAMDRKPGTLPPSWASQGDEKKEAILVERNAAQAQVANQLGRQPEKLLTSKETDVAKDPRQKVRRLKPKQETAPSLPPAALKRKAK